MSVTARPRAAKELSSISQKIFTRSPIYVANNNLPVKNCDPGLVAKVKVITLPTIATEDPARSQVAPEGRFVDKLNDDASATFICPEAVGKKKIGSTFKSIESVREVPSGTIFIKKGMSRTIIWWSPFKR